MSNTPAADLTREIEKLIGEMNNNKNRKSLFFEMLSILLKRNFALMRIFTTLVAVSGISFNISEILGGTGGVDNYICLSFFILSISLNYASEIYDWFLALKKEAQDNLSE